MHVNVLLYIHCDFSYQRSYQLHNLNFKIKMPIELVSPAFEDGDTIPNKYSADGDNVNPALEISDVPDEAISLVIVVESPDTDRTHWLMWNIDPSTRFIQEDEAPEDAMEAYNDFNTIGYSGPQMDDDSDTEYCFHVYALDTELELDEDVTRDKLEKSIAGHILDEAILTVTKQ